MSNDRAVRVLTASSLMLPVPPLMWMAAKLMDSADPYRPEDQIFHAYVMGLFHQSLEDVNRELTAFQMSSGFDWWRHDAAAFAAQVRYSQTHTQIAPRPVVGHWRPWYHATSIAMHTQQRAKAAIEASQMAAPALSQVLERWRTEWDKRVKQYQAQAQLSSTHTLWSEKQQGTPLALAAWLRQLAQPAGAHWITCLILSPEPIKEFE